MLVNSEIIEELCMDAGEERTEKAKKYKKILLIATGALTNSTTSQQGETIPGIAHAISIEL